MNTGQTVYEQLQEFLNECMDLGWKPYGISKFSVSRGRFMVDNIKKGYHDLFSKDSGIMEFVEWNTYAENDEFFVSRKGKYILNTLEYHYMIMSMLTAEEKVIYFNKNATLPTKSER